MNQSGLSVGPWPSGQFFSSLSPPRARFSSNASWHAAFRRAKEQQQLCVLFPPFFLFFLLPWNDCANAAKGGPSRRAVGPPFSLQNNPNGLELKGGAENALLPLPSAYLCCHQSCFQNFSLLKLFAQHLTITMLNFACILGQF